MVNKINDLETIITTNTNAINDKLLMKQLSLTTSSITSGVTVHTIAAYQTGNVVVLNLQLSSTVSIANDESILKINGLPKLCTDYTYFILSNAGLPIDVRIKSDGSLTAGSNFQPKTWVSGQAVVIANAVTN